MRRRTPGGQSRPRVVFLGHVARMSGGEIALLRLVGALLHDVDVVVILAEDGPLVARLRALGVPVEVMPLDPRVRDVRRGTVRPGGLNLRITPTLFSYVLRLRRRLRQLQPDLVHTNSLKAALYGGVAARLAGIPVIWHIRDRISTDYLPRPAVRMVRAAARVLPTAIVVNSQSTLATVPQRHAQVLYNPVIPDAVERRPAARPHSGSGLTIGVLGRLAPWKGQHVFLDAFARAFHGGPARGRLIGSAMFGEEDYQGQLYDQAARLGIGDQIEFLGFCDDVWAELERLDILVHCSVTPEPFGQVVLEGLAAGLPVIAAGEGGPAEIITDGVDGLLVRPRDAPALAAALRRLADDPDLRDRLGEAAQATSRQFTPERTAAQLLEVYREVLGRQQWAGLTLSR